jgi:hypothetical protein
MRCRIALTALLIGTLAMSGCASFPGDQTLPDDLFKAARQSEKAPEGFDNGLPRASCGEVTLSQGEQIPTDAVDCINASVGSVDAELAVVSLTSEGDPIVSFYRTAADEPGMEKFTDGEFDKYGPKAWTHEICRDKTALTSLHGCSAG